MYSIDSHTLHFINSYQGLQVVDDSNTVVATYDLTQNNPPYAVKVVDNAYVIGTNFCSSCSEVFAIDVEANAGEASFNGNRLGGLNILDLRDTGRTGLTIVFHLACGPVGIRRASGSYALRFLSATSDCYEEE